MDQKRSGGLVDRGGMSDKYKALSYLLAANFETVFIILGTWFCSQWLDKNFPIEMGWIVPMIVLGFLAILNSWFRIYKVVKKLNEK